MTAFRLDRYRDERDALKTTLDLTKSDLDDVRQELRETEDMAKFEGQLLEKTLAEERKEFGILQQQIMRQKAQLEACLLFMTPESITKTNANLVGAGFRPLSSDDTDDKECITID